MSGRNYEPRYGRNYMKPIYTGGICIPALEEPFEDTLTANGDYGPIAGHFNSVTVHVAVPLGLEFVSIFRNHPVLFSSFTGPASGSGYFDLPSG